MLHYNDNLVTNESSPISTVWYIPSVVVVGSSFSGLTGGVGVWTVWTSSTATGNGNCAGWWVCGGGGWECDCWVDVAAEVLATGVLI